MRIALDKVRQERRQKDATRGQRKAITDEIVEAANDQVMPRGEDLLDPPPAAKQGELDFGEGGDERQAA